MELNITEQSNVKFNDLIFGPIEDGKISIGINKQNKFIKIPVIGKQIIHLLGKGNNIKATVLILEDETLNTKEVEQFVKQLCGLGFVARVDNIIVNELESNTKNSKNSNYFRFLKHPVTLCLMGFFSLFSIINLINNLDALKIHSLFWSRYTFLSFITYQFISWSILFLHEYGHVIAAKSVGIESNLGIKFQGPFITAYTRFESLWSKTRNERIFTYLGGVIIEILILGISTIIITSSNNIHIVTLLKVVMTICTLGFLSQLQLMFKTDMYLIIKEISKKDILSASSKLKRSILRGYFKEKHGLLTWFCTFIHTIAFISRLSISLYIISLVYYYSYRELILWFQHKNLWFLLSGVCSIIIQTVLLLPSIKSVVLRLFKSIKKKNLRSKRSLYDSAN